MGRAGQSHPADARRSHDYQYAYERIQAGLPMPGVFEVRQAVPIGVAIEDLALLIECSMQDEWEGQVRYLPLTQ